MDFSGLTQNQKKFLQLNTLIQVDSFYLQFSSIRKLKDEFKNNGMNNWIEKESENGRTIEIKIRNKFNYDCEDQNMLRLLTKYASQLDTENFDNFLKIGLIGKDQFDFSVENCFDSLLSFADRLIQNSKDKLIMIVEGILSNVDCLHSKIQSNSRHAFVTHEDLNNAMFKLSFERNLDYEFTESDKETIDVILSCFYSILTKKFKFGDSSILFEEVRKTENSKAKLLGITNEKSLVLVL